MRENQLLLWDFYQDSEDLIFYHHVISGSGNPFTREGEGERETWVFFERITSRQKLTRAESERVPSRQLCLYLLFITQLEVRAGDRSCALLLLLGHHTPFVWELGSAGFIREGAVGTPGREGESSTNSCARGVNQSLLGWKLSRGSLLKAPRACMCLVFAQYPCVFCN